MIVQRTPVCVCVCEGREADFISTAIYLYEAFCNKQFQSRFKENRNRNNSAKEKDVLLLLFQAVSSPTDADHAL